MYRFVLATKKAGIPSFLALDLRLKASANYRFTIVMLADAFAISNSVVALPQRYKSTHLLQSMA